MSSPEKAHPEKQTFILGLANAFGLAFISVNFHFTGP